MNFVPFNAHTTPLFKNCNILTFAAIINVEKICIFINNSFNQDSFPIFNENFKLVSTTRSHNIKSARNALLFVPSYNAVRFGRKSLSIQNAFTLNYLQDKSNDNYIILYNFLCLTPRNLKILLAKFFISEYSS